jgi:uncharacterized protein (TIGR02453 family)
VSYFTDQSFAFLAALARHNERAWFHAHKAEYERHVREPFLALVADLQPAVVAFSPHFRADPRAQGGSLYRIQRDTRYAADKRPYKHWQGARFFHARRREVVAPIVYLHLEPGECFVGAGLWHIEPAIQRRVRQFIVDNPGAWSRAAHAPAFRRRYFLDSDNMLVRPPRGYPEDHPHVEDLRRREFAAMRLLPDATMTGPRLRQVLERDIAALAPLVDYLCAALDLEF